MLCNFPQNSDFANFKIVQVRLGSCSSLMKYSCLRTVHPNVTTSLVLVYIAAKGEVLKTGLTGQESIYIYTREWHECALQCSFFSLKLFYWCCDMLYDQVSIQLIFL